MGFTTFFDIFQLIGLKYLNMYTFYCSNDDSLPSVSDVCDKFGLNDVELDYTEADYQNLTTHKLFQQTYQSRIQGANPKSPKPKLMMLLAAKWREFQASAAEAEAEPEEEAPEEEEEEEEEEVVEEEVEEEEKPRGRGQRRGARTKKAKQVEEVFDFSDDEEDDDRRRSSKKTSRNETTRFVKNF